MSAFLAYSKHMRSSVQSENPQQSNSDISAVLAKKWKEASNDVRQSYQKMAKEEMRIYKDKAQAYRDEKRHEQGQQRKQREEMAMKLVDSDVIMVPYEQCNYDNFSYVNISSYSDSVPQQSQRRHDCFERNTPNNSDTNHYADNANHWKRPFGKKLQ